jgi:UDP-N-acetylglucosamine 3-dehydrogenase
MTNHQASNDLRIGIVGCGGIGRTHLQAYRALGVAPVALADPFDAPLRAAVDEYGGTPYADYADMFGQERLDAVSVCTPPALHQPITEAALAHGIAVLCEKPMATTVEACQAMIAAAEHSGTLLSVGFCHRFQPHVERLKEMVADGSLGTVRMFRNRFAGHLPNVENLWFSKPAVAGGGVLFDTSVHSVDLFRHLIGDPVQVQALMSTMASDLGPALEVEDTAIMSLRTADGALGVIEASWRTPPGEWFVTLYGTRGAATVDYGTDELRVRLASDDTWRVVPVEPGNRFERELAHFLQCVRGLATPRVTGADGLAATRILLQAYAAADG